MIKYLFTKLFLIFFIGISFLVMLWQKTRVIRSFFLAECRFYPSCSDYFLKAIKQHGLTLGLYLFAKRLLKCHPLCEGGIDEVPVLELEKSNGF